ncbi:MAG: right-handed parallel beta-helix repeat-containing protein, partial [Bacteroidota bacterium]
MKIIIFTFSFLVMSQMTLLSQEIYVVTKPYDVDPIIHQYHFVDSLCDQEMYGTYQWALRKVNDTPGPCIIQFAISGVGPQTLNILYELPGLTNPYSVAIDGTTQPGYQYGQPVIIIDGGNVLTIGITCYFGNNIEIKGIQIQNFYLYGILINDCNTGVIESNVVIGGPYIGILLYESFSFSVIGNYLGTNYFLDSGLGCDWMGIRIDNYYGSIASNHVIGGTGQNEGNTIAFNENYGIQVLYATNNLITRNRIFNNSWGGIALSFTANNAKICPFINSFVDTIITGTSQPNDIIEIFGSTGNQNANEYLTTVTANAGGEWSAVITNNNYANCIATATDALNNTSQLSNALMAEIPTTQLIASDCGATNVEFDQVLTAEIVIGADQYLFHVFNQSGFDEILTKSASAFSLNELTGQVEYNTTYSVEVRMIFQNDTSAWGNTCAITTVNLLPGQCCETAILIDQIPSDETYEFINSDELWLTFVADTSVLLIHIIEPDTFPVANVQNITLYKGDCNNLIISSESDSDSYDIFIYDYNLVIGETYFIKLLKDNFNNEFTSVSIPKIYDPMHENDCVYNNLLCERIINGNFSINTATINPFTSNYAFWSNDVTGWKAFWGSADLLDGLSPGNPYALMWNTFSPTGNRTGEGIVSCALIGSGIEYLLNYSIARRT